jgi:nitroreductase
MTVLDAILKRRSVRAYTGEPIPADVMRDLIEAMRHAPSASNKQPWKFIVVDDPGVKDRLVSACLNQRFIAQAPVVVAIAGNSTDAWRGKGGHVRNWEVVDCAIAMDHLQLAACERGLGTCWIGAYDAAAVDGVLGVKEPWHTVVLTPLGYPSENPPSRGRKRIEETVSYNAFK